MSYLKEIATTTQLDNLLSFLDEIDQKKDYHEGFNAFGLINEIVNTNEKVQGGVEALCKQLANDRG